MGSILLRIHLWRTGDVQKPTRSITRNATLEKAQEMARKDVRESINLVFCDHTLPWIGSYKILKHGDYMVHMHDV